MHHVLIIPDGMRRYAQRNAIPHERSYELAVTKLAKLAQTLLSDPNLDEVTYFVAAPYNLDRSPAELAGIRAGAERFFEILPHHIDTTVSVNIIGELHTLEAFAPRAYTHAFALKGNSECTRSKRLNILTFYDYFSACPEDIPLKRWRPFRAPVDLIFRFGQPRDLVRGSALFPMSEQAFWSGVPELFLDFAEEDVLPKITDLLAVCEPYRTKVA